MGVPRVMPRTIVVDGVGEVAGAMVNVGNPHFVMFVETDDFGSHGMTWQALGAKISASPLFPHGTNVEFVRVLAAGEIAFRIFERGCGPTTSSGTGTCASAAAAIALRGCTAELTAEAEGGVQRVVWPGRGVLPGSRGNDADGAGGAGVCGGDVLKKPRTLRKGSVLGVVSPASAAVAEKVWAGCAALEAVGYGVKVFPHALDRGPLYYAGRVEDRVADLHAAFADPEVDAVICTRGGWGSAELLPYLDAGLIGGSGKAFLGYSDHTSLHTWLGQRCGVVSFQAPMVAADWSKPGGVDLASWAAALGGVGEWSVGGLRTLQAGEAEGVLFGGCLAILAEGLGTPYGVRAPGGVLFLEDIGVKPYQWDRMLVHLRFAGVLDGGDGDCVRGYGAVLPGCGTGSAGGGDSACAAGFQRADCDWVCGVGMWMPGM